MQNNRISPVLLAFFAGLGCNHGNPRLPSDSVKIQPECSTQSEPVDCTSEDAQSKPPEVEWDSRLEALVLFLKDPYVLAYGPIGRGATESPYNQTWAQTLEEEHAVTIFQRVFNEGQGAARIYALLGLWHCDPKAFNLSLPKLENGSQELTTGMGCLLHVTTLKSFLAELDPVTGDSSWAELFQTILDAS